MREINFNPSIELSNHVSADLGVKVGTRLTIGRIIGDPKQGEGEDFMSIIIISRLGLRTG